MTIRELFREFVVARRRLEDQAHRDIAQAWWVVRIWMMSQKGNGKMQLPALASLTRSASVKKTARQSPDQMRAALELLSRQYGIPIQQVH